MLTAIPAAPSRNPRTNSNFHPCRHPLSNIDTHMTMTFNIPDEVQNDVAGIPHLDDRVALYLRHEARLEALRRQRYSDEARDIAARAVSQAQRDQAAGFDWDASFSLLQEQHRAITAKL